MSAEAIISPDVSTPSPFYVSPDITWHLVHTTQDVQSELAPGGNVTFEYYPTSVEEIHAFQDGKVILKSRFAIAGARLQSLLVVPPSQENENWKVQAVIQNTGPIHFLMPNTYDLLRWYKGDENPLTGTELLEVAKNMGDTSYIRLRNKNGKSYAVEEINSNNFAGNIEEFEEVELPYRKNEKGKIGNNGYLALGEMHGRREGLDQELQLKWVSTDEPLLNDQQVYLQQTDHATVPERIFGIVQYNGSGRRSYRHGTAVGLQPITEFAEYNWRIIGESFMPPGTVLESIEENDFYEPSTAMRVKLFRMG